MMFVLLTVWFAFNMVLVENHPRPYCQKHACAPFREERKHQAPGVRERRFTDQSWLSIFNVRRSMPAISHSLAQLTSYLDPANQTGPKVLQYTTVLTKKIQVSVYYPPDGTLNRPTGRRLQNMNIVPEYVYAWTFTTNETNPDSSSVKAEIRYFFRLLSQASLRFKKDRYFIAFFEDFPFLKKKRSIEIWFPVLQP